MANTFVAQGTLNRIRCSIVFANFPGLQITASYMGKSMASVTFNDNFVDQIKTATGTVISPEPYVMTSVAVNLLRTTPLGAAWLAQLKDTGSLGPATIYSDTNAFPDIDLVNVTVSGFNPAAYDGTDPAIHLGLQGVFYVNNSLWSLV